MKQISACLLVASCALLSACAADEAASGDAAPAAGRQQSSSQSNQHIQRVSVAAHDHWKDLRDSSVDFAYVRLFSSEPESPDEMIIRVTGRVGEVGQVASDTICWVASRPGEEPVYETAAVICRDQFAYSSSESDVMLRGYWPVDANDDGIDDLVVLGWMQGDQYANVQDEKGIWQTRRVEVDKPAELRVITRGPTGKAWRGIVSDQSVVWSALPEPRDQFAALLAAAAEVNADENWRGRLIRAIADLRSPKSPATGPMNVPADASPDDNRGVSAGPPS